MRLQVLIVLAAFLATAFGTPEVRAHGGVYRGPPYPSVPPTSGPKGTPRGARGGGGITPGYRGGSTPSIDVRKWETWWALNKDEFFPIRGVSAQEGNQGYDPNRRAPTPEEVRKHILPVLIEMTRDRDKEVRNSAAVALGKVGGEPEVDHLEGLLSDKDRSVIEGAILGLGLLRCGPAEEILIKAAQDQSRSARERGMALMALGFSGGDLARTHLMDGLGKPRARSRDRSANLASLQAIAAGLASGSDLPENQPVTGDPATGHLIRSIEKNRVKDRSYLPLAYVALAKTGDEAAQKQALAGLAHRKADVRSGAAITLGRVFRNPDRRTVKQISRALDQEGDLLPRRLMLISLGRMGGEAARDLLVKHLRHRDRQHRSFAIIALGIMGVDELARDFQAEMMSSGDHSLKSAYAISLGLMNHKASAKLIRREIARNKNPEARSYLVQALMLLGDRDEAETIERVLSDARVPDLQASAALCLGLLGAQGSIAVLLQHLKENGTIAVKGAAATGLGRMGDMAVVEDLVKFVRNRKEQDLARAFGCIALGILGEKSPSIPTFARVAIDSQYDIQNAVLFELRDIL